jgi:hypothetical protein
MYKPDILGGPYSVFNIGYFVILDNRRNIQGLVGLSAKSHAFHENLAVITTRIFFQQKQTPLNKAFPRKSILPYTAITQSP